MPQKKKVARTAAKSAPAPKRRKRKIVIKAKPKPTNAIEIDDVFRKLNFVQVERAPVSFVVRANDALIVENIMKDAGVLFEKSEDNDEVEYNVTPGEKEEEGSHALDALEELDDEVLEDGQIFD